MTSLNSVETINPEQAQRALALLWRAGVPAALIGGVGCGKTTAVREFVNKLNKGKVPFKLWTCILSYMEASDIGGIPVPDQKSGKVKYLTPEFLPFDTDDAGVIFGDEFDRATPEVQNAFLQVLLGGEFHGHKMSPKAYCVLAMNGESDIYTTPLSRAARTRVCSLFLSRHASGCNESYAKWASNNGVNEVVQTFARFRTDLYEQDEEFTEIAQCVGRTADMAGRVLDAVKKVSFPTTDILLPCLAGLVGKKAALELMATQKLVDEGCPTLEDIVKDPTGTKVPENMSVIYTLIRSAVRSHTAENKKEVRALATYAARIPDEWAAVLMNQLMEKSPSACAADTTVTRMLDKLVHLMSA